MRKWLVLLLVLAVFLTPARANAQGTVSFSTLEVVLWPEFDEPAMLLIYYIQLSPDTALPAEVTLRIPASAIGGGPYVVAIGDTFDQASDENVVYRVEPDGAWLQVIIQANGPAIIMEYYDPLALSGDARSYEFAWPGSYAVEDLLFRVQEPASAIGLQSNRELVDLGVPTGEELRYFGFDAGALAAGQEYLFTLSYRNPDNLLSEQAMTVQPAGALDETTSGRIPLTHYLPWAALVTGALLVIGGLAFYFRSGGGRRAKGRARHTRTRESDENGQDTYCPQCGARARSGDHFCRTCGTKLRH